jgi:hypothetical protein
MRRSLVPVLTVVLLVAAIPAGAAPAAADGFVAVSTTVTPTDPVPEETFTVAANVSNSDDASTAYTVDHVALREGSDQQSDLVAERDASRRVRPGASRRVDIDASLNDTGTHTVYLHMELSGEGLDRKRIVHPVRVQVYQPHPQVGVSTDASAPGDEQTMTLSVSNGLESAIRNVELVVDSDTVDVRNPRGVAASVAGGGEAAFEFTTVPDSEAVPDGTATRYYTHDGERRNVTYTLATDFSVSESTSEHPQVDVNAESAAPGEPRTTTVTLSNGLESSIRNVELAVVGDRVKFGDGRRVTAALNAGASQTFEFTATPAEATTLPVEVSVNYTLDGERRGVTRTLDADYSIDDEPAERPQVEVSVPDAVAGATRPVNVTVANGLDRDLRQFVVRATSPEAELSVTERVRARLTAGDTATFRFPATVASAGTYPVNVTVLYTDEGIRQRVTRTFRPSFGAPANPGEVTLTGVDAVAEDGTLELSATASNVGSGDVESVVVATGDSEAVVPADYFVGSVEGSDFASFTLTTGVTGNLSTVPVEVSYVVDGVERTYATDVAVQQVTDDVPTRSGGGGPPLTLIAGGVVALVVLVLVVRRWR